MTAKAVSSRVLLELPPAAMVAEACATPNHRRLAKFLLLHRLSRQVLPLNRLTERISALA